MWSKSDERFLRSLGIASAQPPEPLPRFRVEPTATAGWYRVIDMLDPHKAVRVDEYGPKAIPNARAAADDRAAELNAKHVKPSGEST